MSRPTDNDNQDQQGDPRTYFAAERTLLAWIRTGLAMMGFGFVVARFGLFLRELASVEGTPAPSKLGASLWVGTTLVLLGVVANLFAAVKHWQTVRRLQRGAPIPMSPMSVGLVVALFLALLGLLIAGYLILGFASES
jgi:putative membrane protein